MLFPAAVHLPYPAAAAELKQPGWPVASDEAETVVPALSASVELGCPVQIGRSVAVGAVAVVVVVVAAAVEAIKSHVLIGVAQSVKHFKVKSHCIF